MNLTTGNSEYSKSYPESIIQYIQYYEALSDSSGSVYFDKQIFVKP